MPTGNVSPGEEVDVTEAMPWFAPPLVSSAVGSTQVATAEQVPTSAEREKDAGTPLHTIPPSGCAEASSALVKRKNKQPMKQRRIREIRNRIDIQVYFSFNAAVTEA